MLSDLLSDSFTKTNKHLLQRDTRNDFGTKRTYSNWSHTVLSCLRMIQLKLGKAACQLSIEGKIWNETVQQNLYTIKTLCAYLSISRSTIFRIMERGEIEPLRIGSAVRFTEAEVNRYITRQQKQARRNEVGF